jgi:hypothetical protein
VRPQQVKEPITTKKAMINPVDTRGLGLIKEQIRKQSLL